jgi:hypothetical protein
MGASETGGRNRMFLTRMEVRGWFALETLVMLIVLGEMFLHYRRGNLDFGFSGWFGAYAFALMLFPIIVPWLMGIQLSRQLRKALGSPDDPRRWKLEAGLHITLMTAYVSLSLVLTALSGFYKHS